MPLDLLYYQDECVEEINDFQGRSLIALEPGLGKTVISLEWLGRHPEAFPALVICPAGAKMHWAVETLNHLGIRASICEGQTPTVHDAGFNLSPRITIINYDIAPYWIDYLKGLKIKTLILDECQMISNATKRTKATKIIARRPPFVLALSGTPLLNRPVELWTIVNILWPDEFDSYGAFTQAYCNPKWTPWGWNYTGSSNLDDLHKKLLVNGMIRRRKKDVLKGLPDKIRRVVPIEISDMDQYHDASTNFMGWLKKNMAHRVRSASKAEKLARVGYLLQLSAKLKIRGVVNWANNFLSETDEKLIMFAIHTKAIDVLQRRIAAKSVVIDGSITGRLRHAAVEQFQKDVKTRLCIGNIHAAGVCINLNAASEVGIMEIPWRPGDLAQAEDRPHRIGQTNTVFINYLIAQNTIEEDLCKLLQKKQGVISSVLDGGPTETDINIYDALLQVLEGRLV